MTDVDLLTQKAKKQAALAEAGLLPKPPFETLRSLVDHTLLKPGYTDEEIVNLCHEAKHFGFPSVCVPSLAVSLARRCLADTDLRIVAAIGFPLGTSPISTKMDEIAFALAQGAHEIEAVPHLSYLRNGRKAEFQEELFLLRRKTQGKICSVVVETSLLSCEEIICATRLISHAEADFIRSGTGFFGGSRFIDAALMYVASSSAIRIKASGDTQTPEQLRSLRALGISRIGTSRGTSLFASSPTKAL